nr:gypsy/Ty3 retroelement polyprotein [Tanacetum cinerariifolium]
MAPSTRSVVVQGNNATNDYGSSNILDGYVRQVVNALVDDKLVSIEQALAKLSNQVLGISLQNQQMGNGNRGNQTHSRMDKIEFPKLNGEDIKVGYSNVSNFLFLTKFLMHRRVEISKFHAISLFMGGLPTEIEMGVRMFKPRTLTDAYCLTNLQEATLNAVKKKNRLVFNMGDCVVV